MLWLNNQAVCKHLDIFICAITFSIVAAHYINANVPIHVIVRFFDSLLIMQ